MSVSWLLPLAFGALAWAFARSGDWEHFRFWWPAALFALSCLLACLARTRKRLGG